MFHVKQSAFDVAVIGGGHAGVEAAQAAYRRGARVVLVTHSFGKIGELSCNPAIGGVGKGHLVREIDALDGVMARVSDQAGIQFRMLNRSKGPAVWGPRAQVDRHLYRTAMQQEFLKRPEIEVIESEVQDLVVEGEAVKGVVLTDGTTIRSAKVVLTTGTFLRGTILIGGKRIPGGRMGERPAIPLAERIEELDIPMGRLKTGTPPRLNGTTVDWDRVDEQKGDENPEPFSFLSTGIDRMQVSCGITKTNQGTHDIIAENLSSSAIYGGFIDSRGPRYCPSIEDKVVKFREKNSHQIFLEPEGNDSNIIYPNGISTSLSEEIQDKFVRTIYGLESVEILQYGYAIEYDYVDPRNLSRSLEVRALKNLYLAGQINGTTGYEEAAAQGLLAGTNAASSALGGEGLTLDRADGYIGVLVDDLVSNGVSEPYRMFTSRAEYRLSLRIDNADQRLTPIGIECGIVSADRAQAFERKMAQLDKYREKLQNLRVRPDTLNQHGIKVSDDGRPRTALEIMRFSDYSSSKLRNIFPDDPDMDDRTITQLEIEERYASYIVRQSSDIAMMRKENKREIPGHFDFSQVPGLSNEVLDKLEAVAPRTIGQVQRIEGITPAAITQLLLFLRKLELREAG